MLNPDRRLHNVYEFAAYRHTGDPVRYTGVRVANRNYVDLSQVARLPGPVADDMYRRIREDLEQRVSGREFTIRTIRCEIVGAYHGAPQDTENPLCFTRLYCLKHTAHILPDAGMTVSSEEDMRRHRHVYTAETTAWPETAFWVLLRDHLEYQDPHAVDTLEGERVSIGLSRDFEQGMRFLSARFDEFHRFSRF